MDAARHLAQDKMPVYSRKTTPSFPALLSTMLQSSGIAQDRKQMHNEQQEPFCVSAGEARGRAVWTGSRNEWAVGILVSMARGAACILSRGIIVEYGTAWAGGERVTLT